MRNEENEGGRRQEEKEREEEEREEGRREIQHAYSTHSNKQPIFLLERGVDC